jgi:hypothetical protein
MGLYLEKGDEQFNAQMKNLAGKIDKYSTTLGLTANEVTSIKTDAAAFDYAVTIQLMSQSFAKNVTSFKQLLRNGRGQVLSDPPEAPVLGTPPAMPRANMESRIRSILQRMIHHPAYNKGIGEDLGIEAPIAVFTPVSGKPKFTINFSSGGYPNLRWKKGKYQGVEIWKDTGAGFKKLDRDMRPDYIDKSNLPPQGTSATWSYKMIYLLNDELMGSWSDVVSITVHGEV